MNKAFRLISVVVSLVALTLGLHAARPALATLETANVKGNMVAWRGGGANNEWSNPANVLPLAPTTFTRTNSLTLNSGEDALFSAVIDTANGFAYFGTLTSPGIVVKVRLSDFTRVGALTLNPDLCCVSAVVIDSATHHSRNGSPFIELFLAE